MKDLIRNIILNNSNVCTNVLKKENLYDEVIQITNFLDEVYDEVSNSQRYWHFIQRCFGVFYCDCGEPAKWSKHKLGYVSCSKKCSILKMNTTNKNLYGNIMAAHGINQKEKTRQTNLERYGVENISQSDLFKNIIKSNASNRTYKEKEQTKEKAKQTNQERYGVDHPMQLEQTKEKAKQTNQERYGVDHPFKNHDNIKQTFQNKYGVDNPMQLEQTKEKAKQTNQERYGVDHHSKSNHHKIKITNTTQLKFLTQIPDGYELIDFGQICALKHNKCGKIFKISRRNLMQRKMKYESEICTYCNPLYGSSVSNMENILLEFIKQYDIKLFHSEHDIIPPYELDIYIPEHKLAIEFNGNYFHSEHHKDKYYHKMKSDLCEEQNIKLIHVWEHDWLNKQEIIKSIISGHLGKYERIYARKCEIKQLQAKDCQEFINNNHLQGFVGATVYYGLIYDSELVSVMSFQKYGGYWEISRLCSKINLIIVGGTEKLWKHFIKENNPNKVISYSNRDYFTGNVYKRLGFIFKRITEPAYWYSNSSLDVLSRQQCQKHKLVKQGYDPNITEHETMLERGYFRCYNSGNYFFEWKKP